MRIDFYVIINVLARICFVESVAFISGLFIALYYNESIYPLLYPAIIVFATGVIAWFSTKKREFQKITIREAYLIVTGAWIIISLFGLLPYLFSGAIPGFVDGFFESVSGFTTTGASIITDVEILPKSILYWRSLTHWIGGIGIIVLVIVIIPSLSIGGQSLFSLESSFQNKIQPRIKSVGFRLLMIYIGLTFAETIMLYFGNMGWFDSLCHSFGTIATGGFSTRNSSIAEYSPYVQYVVIAFMLLAGTNFLIHYYIVKREFKKIIKNEELRLFYFMIFAAAIVITLILLKHTQMPFEKTFRDSLFQVTSIVTCTGFATVDYLKWPAEAWIIIFFLMFLGGSIGSTSGGIKMLRHLVMVKSLRRIIWNIVHPNAVLKIRINGHTMDEDKVSSIVSFILMYLLIFIISSIFLVGLGLDLETSIGAAATCMGGIGPGIGSVGPAATYAHLPDTAKLVLSALMIIGRLEIYTVIAVFTISFWKK